MKSLMHVRNVLQPKWTKEEMAILPTRVGDIRSVLPKLPGRSYQACYNRMLRSGLINNIGTGGIRPWLEERAAWWRVPGRMDRLLELKKVHTCTEIARMLGTTKNAVSGKIDRMRLESWEPPPPRVYVFERVKTRECRWPIGDPGDSAFRLCGAEALIGRSYCADHLRVGYTVIEGRRVA